MLLWRLAVALLLVLRCAVASLQVVLCVASSLGLSVCFVASLIGARLLSTSNARSLIRLLSLCLCSAVVLCLMLLLCLVSVASPLTTVVLHVVSTLSRAVMRGSSLLTSTLLYAAPSPSLLCHGLLLSCNVWGACTPTCATALLSALSLTLVLLLVFSVLVVVHLHLQPRLTSTPLAQVGSQPSLSVLLFSCSCLLRQRQPSSPLRERSHRLRSLLASVIDYCRLSHLHRHGDST